MICFLLVATIEMVVPCKTDLRKCFSWFVCLGSYCYESESTSTKSPKKNINKQKPFKRWQSSKVGNVKNRF